MLVGVQPILVFMSKVDGSFKFSSVSVDFLTEVAKVPFSVIMLLLQARDQKVGEKPLLSVSTFVQFLDVTSKPSWSFSHNYGITDLFTSVTSCIFIIVLLYLTLLVLFVFIINY